jgi:transposase
MITYSLQHLEYLESHILELDQEIATMIMQASLFPQLELLQTIPGLQERSASTILAETGGDLTAFPSASHLSSWGGVCPGNNRSAGKSKSSRTTKGNPFLRSALTECAWAAAATKNSFLRDKFWRVTSRSGGKKPPAVLAVAHTLLLLIYQVLTTAEPFTDRTAPITNDKQWERLIRHHVRKLGKLGISISRSVLTPPGEKRTHRRRTTDIG